MRSLYEAIMDSDDKILKSSEADMFKSLLVAKATKTNLRHIRRMWTKFGLDLPGSQWCIVDGDFYAYHSQYKTLISISEIKKVVSVFICKEQYFEDFDDNPNVSYHKWIKDIEKKLEIKIKDIDSKVWLLLFHKIA